MPYNCSPESTRISTGKSTGKSADLVRMSGLSGISDIIGEMVQKGEIDLQDAGFSQKEAQQFSDKVKLRLVFHSNVTFIQLFLAQ